MAKDTNIIDGKDLIFKMFGGLRTRSGLIPDTDRLPYTITTEKARNYLQRQIDATCHRLEKQGNAIGKVKLTLYSSEASKQFIPFVVLLPKNVLRDHGKKEKKHEEVLDAFSDLNTDNNGPVMLNPEIHRLFAPYVYTAKEGKDFRNSRSWSNETKVFNATVKNTLVRFRIPRVLEQNRNDQAVGFIIDPLKVFTDMLVFEEDENQNFKIEVESLRKLSTTEYEYKVRRMVNKHGNKGGKKEGAGLVNMLQQKRR